MRAACDVWRPLKQQTKVQLYRCRP